MRRENQNWFDETSSEIGVNVLGICLAWFVLFSPVTQTVEQPSRLPCPHSWGHVCSRVSQPIPPRRCRGMSSPETSSQLTDSSSEHCGIGLRPVHPSAARTALVGRASACQSERSSDATSSAPPLATHAPGFPSHSTTTPSWHDLRAYLCAPLRLCVEVTFPFGSGRPPECTIPSCGAWLERRLDWRWVWRER